MHWVYLLVLAACLVATLPLELVLHVRVYVQWQRLIGVLSPVVVLFGAEDLLAIHQRWWFYDERYLIGIALPGTLPLEELLFFVVIPICAILTYEAVLVRRPNWARS